MVIISCAEDCKLQSHIILIDILTYQSTNFNQNCRPGKHTLHANYFAAVLEGMICLESPFPKQMKQIRYYCKQELKLLKFSFKCFILGASRPTSNALCMALLVGLAYFEILVVATFKRNSSVDISVDRAAHAVNTSASKWCYIINYMQV